MARKEEDDSARAESVEAYLKLSVDPYIAREKALRCGVHGLTFRVRYLASTNAKLSSVANKLVSELALRAAKETRLLRELNLVEKENAVLIAKVKSKSKNEERLEEELDQARDEGTQLIEDKSRLRAELTARSKKETIHRRETEDMRKERNALLVGLEAHEKAMEAQEEAFKKQGSELAEKTASEKALRDELAEAKVSITRLEGAVFIANTCLTVTQTTLQRSEDSNKMKDQDIAEKEEVIRKLKDSDQRQNVEQTFKIKELQEKIALKDIELQDKMAAANQALQEEKDASAQTLAQAQAEHRSEIEAKDSESSGLVELMSGGWESTFKDAEELSNQALSKVKAELQAAETKLRDQNSALKAKHDIECKQCRKHKQDMSRLEDKIEAMTSELREEKDLKSEDFSRIKGEYEDKLARKDKDHEAALAAASAAGDEKLAQSNQDHQVKVQTIENDHKAKLVSMTKEHEAELSKKESELSDVRDSIEAHGAEIVKSNSEVLVQVRDKNMTDRTELIAKHKEELAECHRKCVAKTDQLEMDVTSQAQQIQHLTATLENRHSQIATQNGINTDQDTSYVRTEEAETTSEDALSPSTKNGSDSQDSQDKNASPSKTPVGADPHSPGSKITGSAAKIIPRASASTSGDIERPHEEESSPSKTDNGIANGSSEPGMECNQATDLPDLTPTNDENVGGSQEEHAGAEPDGNEHSHDERYGDFAADNEPKPVLESDIENAPPNDLLAGTPAEESVPETNTKSGSTMDYSKEEPVAETDEPNQTTLAGPKRHRRKMRRRHPDGMPFENRISKLQELVRHETKKGYKFHVKDYSALAQSTAGFSGYHIVEAIQEA